MELIDKDAFLKQGRKWYCENCDRRDRCVERIMQETGCDKWTATIAYRIATAGLQGVKKVTEVEA